MSILVRFAPLNLTRDQYEEVNRRLEATGDAEPDGQQLHVCFGNEGELRVSEVWESEEKMRAFGERLMPVLEEVGIQMAAEPEVLPVVNYAAG
jgi:D-mannonate dehydratase